MKGLELSKEYYKEFGEPMLKNLFSDKLDRIAVGLVGHGSECFGFDDEYSIDHDFEPGFTIWITDEDYDDFGFRLFREYSKLPKEYKGYKVEHVGAFGPKYKGVHTISEFYSNYIGTKLPETLDEWMNIPEYYLAEATNGEVFFDNLGEFTRIRNYLINRPADIKFKKLSSAVFHMAQSGQYNYKRCIEHKEFLSASLALNEFSKSTAEAIYLLNDRFAPYYKWMFKGLDNLEKLNHVKSYLTTLIEKPYEMEANLPLIEMISSFIANELRKEGLSDKTDDYLEPYAYCVLNKVKDASLRNTPIVISENE